MRVKISKYGYNFYINIDSNKPKWLVRLLFPFYWRWLPWKDTAKPLEPLTPESYDTSGHGGPKC